MTDSLLPVNLQDKSFLALEECAKKALKIDMKPFMTSIVDYLPDAILDELAEEFHIKEEGYNDAKNRKERIALIKNAVTLHKRKGTVGAVEDFLESLGAKCKMWRDYGGIPHHYKIDVDYIGVNEGAGSSDLLTGKTGEKGVDPYKTAEKIVEQLEYYKQLRAKLDEINMSVGTYKELYVTNAVLIGETIVIDIKGY